MAASGEGRWPSVGAIVAAVREHQMAIDSSSALRRAAFRRPMPRARAVRTTQASRGNDLIDTESTRRVTCAEEAPVNLCSVEP
jgi:hypothetical protein